MPDDLSLDHLKKLARAEKLSEAIEQASEESGVPITPETVEEAAAVVDYEGRIAEIEDDLGLEYVGPDAGQNRAQIRESVKTLKRVTRRPVAVMSLRHPLLGSLTPHGAKVLRKRRAKAKVAKQSRKRNRGS